MAGIRKKKIHICLECEEHFLHGIGLRKHHRQTGHKGGQVVEQPFRILAQPDNTRIPPSILLRVGLATSALSLLLLASRLAKYQLGTHPSVNRSLFEPRAIHYSLLEFAGLGLLAFFVLALTGLGFSWWRGTWSQATKTLEAGKVSLLSGALGAIATASLLNWIHLEPSWFLVALALSITSDFWIRLIPERQFPPDPKRDGFLLAAIVPSESSSRFWARRSNEMPRVRTSLRKFRPQAKEQVSETTLRKMLDLFHYDCPNLTNLAKNTKSIETMLELLNRLHSQGKDIAKLEPILDAVVFCEGNFEDLVCLSTERIRIYGTA